MNTERIFIVAIAALVAVAVVIFGIGWWFNRPTLTPAIQPQTQSGQQNTSSVSNQTTSVSVPQILQTKEAVRGAFLKQQGQVKVGKIAIVGDWALLDWTDEPMGGEAVLKYDSSLMQWVVASFTGGAYSVAGLHDLGIPQKTVLTLLNSLKIDQ